MMKRIIILVLVVLLLGLGIYALVRHIANDGDELPAETTTQPDAEETQESTGDWELPIDIDVPEDESTEENTTEESTTEEPSDPGEYGTIDTPEVQTTTKPAEDQTTEPEETTQAAEPEPTTPSTETQPTEAPTTEPATTRPSSSSGGIELPMIPGNISG